MSPEPCISNHQWTLHVKRKLSQLLIVKWRGGLDSFFFSPQEHGEKAHRLQNCCHTTKLPWMSLEPRENAEQDCRSCKRPPCELISEVTTLYPFWVSIPQEGDRLGGSNIFLTKMCWKKTNADKNFRNLSSLPLSNSYRGGAPFHFLCFTRLPPSKLFWASSGSAMTTHYPPPAMSYFIYVKKAPMLCSELELQNNRNCRAPTLSLEKVTCYMRKGLLEKKRWSHSPGYWIQT